MAQPSAYNPNLPPGQPAPAYTPNQYTPQTHPPQYYQPPVHQPPQSQSTSKKIGGGLGGVFASIERSVKPTLNSAIKAGGELAGSTKKGYNDSKDRQANTPVMRCFAVNSGVQLISKTGRGTLRCLPDGTLDCRGTIGPDYSCHWLVGSSIENRVILRNGAFPQYHLIHANPNQVFATGMGDQQCVYKIHETRHHHVNLEHQLTGRYVGCDEKQGVVSCDNNTAANLEQCKFEVLLAYSPTGHTYHHQANM